MDEKPPRIIDAEFKVVRGSRRGALRLLGHFDWRVFWIIAASSLIAGLRWYAEQTLR